MNDQIRKLAETLAEVFRAQFRDLKADREAQNLLLQEINQSLDQFQPLEREDLEADSPGLVADKLEASQRLQEVAQLAPEELRQWAEKPRLNPRVALELFNLPSAE